MDLDKKIVIKDFDNIKETIEKIVSQHRKQGCDEFIQYYAQKDIASYLESLDSIDSYFITLEPGFKFNVQLKKRKFLQFIRV